MSDFTEERREEDKNLAAKLAVIIESINNIKGDVSELKDDFKKLREVYVSKVEFAPVKTITFGLVGILLLGVITAILKVVVK